MTPQEVTAHIKRWISTCSTNEHFDGIQMAINNCLLPLRLIHGPTQIGNQENEIAKAIYHRKVKIGLIQRVPSDDEL